METLNLSSNLRNLCNFYLRNLLNKLYNIYNIKFIDIQNYESHFYLIIYYTNSIDKIWVKSNNKKKSNFWKWFKNSKYI